MEMGKAEVAGGLPEPVTGCLGGGQWGSSAANRCGTWGRRGLTDE